MSQPEVCPQCLQTLARLLVLVVALFDYDYPVVVYIALKLSHAVGRYLVLEVDARNRWTDIVRVQRLVSGDLPQLDVFPIFNVLDGLRFVVVLGIIIEGGVENTPHIVVIPVWVESDLLF